MAGCNSDPLPKPTQDGNNTFGCMIDGKAWIPDGGTGFMPTKPINGGFSYVKYNPKTIGISIRTYAKSGEFLEILVTSIKEGKYLLNEDTQPSPPSLFPKNYGVYSPSNNGNLFITSSKNIGEVLITKSDTASGIISGTFEFRAANSNGQQVSITSGRFDINSKTL
jgi:hypothetical protein